MTDQLSLSFDQDMARRFEVFHSDNPRVYEVLLTLAREWVKRTNGRKLGIGALTERARWELVIETNDPDYRINNTHRAFYARLLMHRNPELRGLFELRKSAADEWIGEVA